MIKFLRRLFHREKKILYLCDRKACEKCNNQCFHTTDITHAANFNEADTAFWEVPDVKIDC